MIAYFKYTFPFGIAVVIGLAPTQGFAQAPSDAQRSAIRSACRSDYMAHCSSVQPGGAAALQCLQKNIASLSSACQTAVKAVSPATDATPATDVKLAPTKPVTASVRAAPAATETTAVAIPAAPAAATATAAAPVSAVLVLRPLRPLEEVRIVNAACGADARAFCSAVEPGGGRVARCLATNAASLSSACRSMLAQFAAR
ncbi:MAG: cysteine rich repeat-containing protein [Pseudolabrys sp.]